MTGGGLAVPGSSCEMTHEERVRAFKSDPRLMEAATRFVNEVLERAKEEASRRAQHDRMERLDTECPVGRGKRGPWHSRARGFLARLFASLCLCNSTDVKA